MAALLFCPLAALPAQAQQRNASAFEAPAARALALQHQQEQEMDENARMTTSGFFFGVVGMLGGAAVGSGVGSARCGEDCVTRAASGGASIMGAITVPIGVHLAAEKPKSLPLAMGASVLAGAAVWTMFNAIPGRPVAMAPFVAAPLQVWIAMKIER